MQNITSKSGVISFRIWIIAVLCNTVIGSLILGSSNSRFIDYMMFGGLFSSFFSLPILFILWALLRYLFYKGFPWNLIMGRLILIGGIFTIVVFCTFSYLWSHDLEGMIWLCILAVASGIIAMVSQFRSIQNVCEIRDNEFIIDEQSSI